MRNDKLIPGTILVIIGVLFLLDNFGTIDFDWFSLVHLWPIILVMAGVNLLFSHNKSHIATIIKMGVLIAGTAFLIISGLNHPHDGSRSWKSMFNYVDFDDSTDKDNIHMGDKNTGHYSQEYKSIIKNAVLNINGGVTNYTISDTTADLFSADTRARGGDFNMTANIDSATQTIEFGQDGGKDHNGGFHFSFGGRNYNKAYIKLNTRPVWEINVQAGVAKINFDLSPYKVERLKIEGGVSSFKVKMGMPLAETNVDVETGVAGLTVSVPKGAACHIVTSDTHMSERHINGFKSVGDNEYETPGFEKAANKMYIRLSGGLSKFRVNQY